jgi:hypothetical protein
MRCAAYDDDNDDDDDLKDEYRRPTSWEAFRKTTVEVGEGSNQARSLKKNWNFHYTNGIEWSSDDSWMSYHPGAG